MRSNPLPLLLVEEQRSITISRSSFKKKGKQKIETLQLKKGKKMVIKRRAVVEITPDLGETKKKTKSKRRKRLSKEEEEEEEEDEGTLLRGIFCLKTRQDMKIFDAKEDCFILDFDPNDSFDARTLSDSPECDEDVAIIHEKGQVACRDFPHPRHLCLKFPFESSQHTSHCNQCYCYVCDLAAPCAHWTTSFTPHCEALENSRWKPLRQLFRNK